MQNGMNRFTKLVESDFDSSTKDFDDKPNFIRKVEVKNTQIVGRNFTDNEVYGFLNYGTKRHFVAPKAGGVLRFRTGYRTKTQRGRIRSRSGGASGGVAYSKGHYVSGIKARKFDKLIKEKRKKDFIDIMSNALRDAID